MHLGNITYAVLDIHKVYQQVIKGFEKPFGKNSDLTSLIFQTFRPENLSLPGFIPQISCFVNMLEKVCLAT